ncbi:unnamed protein product [Brassica oleracea var. botrytis]
MESTENDGKKFTASCGVTAESSNPETQKKSQETESSSASEVQKNTSKAWLHFKKSDEVYGKAKCMHCSQLISCRTTTGSTTSAMLKHIQCCKMLRPEVSDAEVEGKKLKQSTLHHQSILDGSSGSKIPSFLAFSQPATRKALVEMVIMDELPFRFVERKGFKRFMSVAQPRFAIPCRKTIAKDCLVIFEEEKSKLRKFFRNYKGSISSTTDCWTSVQNMSYMCLTAHYMDESWKLHKRIINFCIVDNHAGETLGKMVEKCLVFWGISKVFTITVDNASSNDLAIKYLKRKLTSWGTSVLDAEFLHMRCGAHILGLIVRDGLKDERHTVLKVRTAVKYVRSSPNRLKRFKECLELQKVECKAGLCLDVETRWNSTFLMLQSAVKLKIGFDMLELEDDKYVSELMKICGGTPSDADWCYISALSSILQYFYDATLNISGSKYVTGNTYMKEIFGVGWMIIKMDNMEDGYKRAMAKKMKLKFYKYWGNFNNTNMLIYVAAALDPRYKMRWVKWMIEETYPAPEAICFIKKITDAMEKLFKYYKSELESQESLESPQKKGKSASSSKEKEKRHSLMDDMFDDAEESEESEAGKTELEYYLDDVREDRKNPSFNILQWWRVTGSKYKVVSMMARDLLAIHVSTVASESAFSAGGRVLDRFRSSLTPRTVEALICTQDWYRDDDEDLNVEELVADLENIESEVQALQIQT